MIELHEYIAKNCTCTCTEDSRVDGICRHVKSEQDGLDLRCVGHWAKEKISLLVKYFDIFAVGMAKKWDGQIHYIEICSGPGRCMIRNERTEIDGTALAVLRHRNFDKIKRAVFVDRDKNVVDTLNLRIKNLGPEIEKKAIAVVGDYEKPDLVVHALQKVGVDPNSLNLVFIDPTDCSVPFSSIRYFKEHMGKTDFILNFPINMDLMRNVQNSILKENFRGSREKYLAFFGDHNFFSQKEIIDLAQKSDLDELRRRMNLKYEAQLKSLGHSYFDVYAIYKLYYLCFASSHERGLSFWKKVTKDDPNGQKTFGFE